MGTNPVGRETPLPTAIRTYGTSILGFLAPTELDTRHPLSKILDPPLPIPIPIQIQFQFP